MKVKSINLEFTDSDITNLVDLMDYIDQLMERNNEGEFSDRMSLKSKIQKSLGLGNRTETGYLIKTSNTFNYNDEIPF